MTTKSLNIKYIEISEAITASDISTFLDDLEEIEIEDARAVYFFIKKDYPMTNNDLDYSLAANDLYNVHDKDGVLIKNYIIKLCKLALEKIIYPVAGSYKLEDANIEGCFTMEYKGSFLVGTTGTNVSFGNNNFINKCHVLFFLLKKFNFPKITWFIIIFWI